MAMHLNPVPCNFNVKWPCETTS